MKTNLQHLEIKTSDLFSIPSFTSEFTALENVCIPAYIAKSTKKLANERAKYLIDLMGLSDRFDHKPSELSGGEQQRISVARASYEQPAGSFSG